MECRYSAIVISKKDIGEADRICVIYTKEAGKVQAKAVGVRKQNAKLAGALENFTLADIAIVKKNGMGKITSSIVENNFSNIKSNLETITAVFEVMEIFNQLVGTDERDEEVFNLLKDYLEVADELGGEGKGKVELISQGFIFKLFKELGYKIEVNSCVYCENRLKNQQNFFSAEQGGIVCQNCASSLKSILPPHQDAASVNLRCGDLPVSVNAIKLARLFLTNSLKSLAKLKAGEREIRELRLTSRAFLDWIVK